MNKVTYLCRVNFINYPTDESLLKGEGGKNGWI